MRRLAVVLSVVLLACVCPTQGVASTRSAQARAAAYQDPDGRNVFLAIGVPGEDVSTVVDAGAVAALYGTWETSVGSQLWTQNGTGGVAEVGDGFGLALAAGDFNGDGRRDLAVGAPDEDFGVIRDAGTITVLYGSEDVGLTNVGAQQFSQSNPDVDSDPEPGDLFGAALADGDFNGDGFTDLAVGVPDEAGLVRAGAVEVFYGSVAGLAAFGSQLFTQNSSDVVGDSETGDGFGAALVAGDFNADGFEELAIGSPGEDVFSRVDAGTVTVLAGTPDGLIGAGSQLFSQDTPGVGGTAEAGDELGFALVAGDLDGFVGSGGTADLAIGAPGEDFSALADAGAVTVLFGNVAGGLGTVGSRVYTQNNIGTGADAERGDAFGYSLAAGDFTGPANTGELGIVDLAIGAPGEDVSGVVDAGLVNVVYDDWPFFGQPLPRTLRYTQVGGAGPEPGDLYGFALTSTGDSFARLAVGAPGEDINTPTGTVVDAGAISLLNGSPDEPGLGGGGLVVVGGLRTQNSPGIASIAESGDLFGAALATTPF